MEKSIQISHDQLYLLTMAMAGQKSAIPYRGINFRSMDDGTGIRLQSTNGHAGIYMDFKDVDPDLVAALDGKCIIPPKINKSDTGIVLGAETLTVLSKSGNRSYTIEDLKSDFKSDTVEFPDMEKFKPQKKVKMRLKINTALLPKNTMITMDIFGSTDPILVKEFYNSSGEAVSGTGLFMPMRIK